MEYKRHGRCKFRRYRWRYSLKLKDTLISREVDGDLLVLNPVSGEFFTLNDVAASMLSLLGEGLTAEQVAEKISLEQQVAVEEVLVDVRELVSSLQSENLVD